jgi:hypothetical protein
MSLEDDSKGRAMHRRELLRKNLGKALGSGMWTPKECASILRKPFPSSLVAGRVGDTLVVACDSADRFATKSKYELDTWALALLSRSMLKDVERLRLVIQAPAATDASSQKWFHFLIRRLSYLRKGTNGRVLELNILRPTAELEAVAIPPWSAILAEGKSIRPYPLAVLAERGSKSKRNMEDMEQDRIKAILDAQDIPAFKEFPISLKHGSLADDAAYRIDIVYRAGPGCLAHVELKAGDNKDLDVCAQSLDYHIYLSQIQASLGADWKP